jgi:hypothetical protein
VRSVGSETTLTGARGMREGLPAASPHMPVSQWGCLQGCPSGAIKWKGQLACSCWQYCAEAGLVFLAEIRIIEVCCLPLMIGSPLPWLPLSTSKGLCRDPPAPDVVCENSWAPSKGVFGDSSCFPCSEHQRAFTCHYAS